ncbi:hypothetical protein T265_07908 [Opisthorchis viverrini]|uniref:Uncharacterized protein n=1 Tax=Opisthorchis viverrini TaxID=6198 RepID=A0A074ZM37_OPIVI|nr:hypothetical protein T265_07908 [Opisthorchis viverrini]KER24435.1 hypothetical protein T265_07908 [Opisthorchis viverrini]
MSAAIKRYRRAHIKDHFSLRCRVLRNEVNDSAYGEIVRDLSLLIRVYGACVSTKDELMAAWGKSPHNSVVGGGLPISPSVTDGQTY